jgi:signal recognition particle subunit SRP54
LLKNEFGFDDFCHKFSKWKMGNMKDLVGMIPGASKAERCRNRRWCFKHIEAIIHSMTPIEKKQAICNRCEKKTLRKVLELK